MIGRSSRARSPRPARQRLFPELERSRRRERWFKRGILALTAVGVAILIGGSSVGRYEVARLANRVRWGLPRLVGYPPDRSEVDIDLRRERARGIERTDAVYRAYFRDEVSPAWRRILEVSGLAPGEALLRWANVDRTVLLSSKVFDVDDSGRAYRLRPSTASFWTSSHLLTRGLSGFFFLPDQPEVRSALAGAKVDILTESFQTTNSWGCRGPEPDLDARVRVLVLGDSFMQGILLPDDSTPPECLARTLREAWGVPVSVLNTGHIGYSPEQYYYTLKEYFDRFRPHCLVVSVCPNDFGDGMAVLAGRGDWAEGMYWVNAIEAQCRARGIPYVLVPAPLEEQVKNESRQGFYPGPLSNLCHGTSMSYLNPINAFIDEHLRLVREGISQGRRPYSSPLFNGHLYDAHFSHAGAALWAREVGRRITLLLAPPSPAGPRESGI